MHSFWRESFTMQLQNHELYHSFCSTIEIVTESPCSRTWHTDLDFWIKGRVTHVVKLLGLRHIYPWIRNCRVNLVARGIAIAVVRTDVGLTGSLVGSGRRSMVAATNGSQRVGGWNSSLKIILSLWNGKVMWRRDYVYATKGWVRNSYTIQLNAFALGYCELKIKCFTVIFQSMGSLRAVRHATDPSLP